MRYLLLSQHIASGTPTVSYLTARRPRWYDRLCHYNPTSIIWRYAAITDRRLRATNWNAHDLAASNAIFWTAKGWDGDESMVQTAAPHCLRYPESKHVELLSLSMMKTIITTLQGCSALYTLVGNVSGSSLPGIAIGFGVDTIFFPLAILGLLRLCAAIWLTEDFMYQSYSFTQDDKMGEIPLQSDHSLARRTTDTDNQVNYSRHNTLDPFLIPPSRQSGFTPPGKSWKSRLFRLFFILVLGGIWAIAILTISPLGPQGSIYFSTTSFLLGIFYLIFTTMSSVLYAYYFARSKTTTTVLPCLSSAWYRLYTLFFMALMMGLIVVASIETNKSINGLYTSVQIDVKMGCENSDGWWPLPADDFYMGIVSARKLNGKYLGHNQTSVAVQSTDASVEESFWLYNFTGYCMGHVDDMR
jgi:hypothetical protein